MKYIAIAVAGLTLAACQPTTRTTIITPAATCDAAPYQQWVGKDSATLVNINTPDNMRVIRPDTAVTMDHDPSRLNVETNQRGVITAVRCG
ncbi:I78 family peptidase inhibitor [Falsirhodobacter sp. 20TX0035]|uniref:I78 family peptidase inhibitor n=1 Tax=Falsirhodobacter sp. 20TX0035 TaxID=3022019 RepID=UPI00232CB315|nr:I78 family peptidase inhibitor [Falsirhodobacter sp. 20TX0035]MDB6453967.1 I78 family peptidase inhibitor [Falsirhodobacter sp. 20TX0035]